MKKVTLLLTGAVMSLAAFAGYTLFNGTEVKASDCSGNAVITCGFSSISQLRAKYNSDSPKGTQTIYNYFKMNSAVVNSASYKTGYVTKSGNVIVGGKVVATDAMTAGRQYMPGSTKHVVSGTTFYTRTPGVSFRSSQLSVIAFFDKDGRFIGASMFDCGNPVMATNKVVPAPKPVYSCDKLSATKISRTEYKFTTYATAKNGASIKNFTYNFGDGKTATSGATVSHIYAKAGTYTVKATANVLVDGKTVAVSGYCTFSVTVTPEMCTVPGKTQYPKDSPECKEDKPSVSIEKTVNGQERETVMTNEVFNYEITVKNTGNVALKSVVVSDKAPANVQFVSSDTGTVKNNTWTTTLTELGVGQSKSFVIKAKLTKYQSGVITNTACVETPTVPGGNPDDCDTAEIDTPNNIQVCDTSTNTVITIEEKDFDASHMTKDLTKCEKMQVCRIEDKTTVTISRNEFDQTKYTEDQSKCAEVPPELPHTGLGNVIGGGFGLSAIAGAVHYYGASRRTLRNAFLK
jgi:uncharacterized repeat protein (TIGR01451 family)